MLHDLQHARHHAATGSMERDEVFVPKTRSQVGLPPAHEQQQKAAAQKNQKEESTFEALDEILEDAPFWNLFWVTMQQLLGWPMYLIRNASGQKYGRWTNREFFLVFSLVVMRVTWLSRVPFSPPCRHRSID